MLLRVRALHLFFERLADSGQVMPTVAQRVIFDHELCGNRRAETQPKWPGLIQIFIAKSPNCLGGGTAVTPQEGKRLTLRYLGLLLGVLRVYLINSFGRH